MKSDLKGEVSINEFGGTLIVAVNPDLDETSLEAIQKSILNTIASRSIDGVVLNFSEVKILDSFLIEKLEEITQMIEVMGTEAVVAGLRPEIVVSLVTLNIGPDSLKTALNVELAIGMLREITPEIEEKQEVENVKLDKDEPDETPD